MSPAVRLTTTVDEATPRQSEAFGAETGLIATHVLAQDSTTTAQFGFADRPPPRSSSAFVGYYDTVPSH